ncbi:MAG TPA: hypothetical protein VES20_09070 [Bryobacteraceae bacterium]|nr:hypothetical protein [Bryobacteraceae bacterium]
MLHRRSVLALPFAGLLAQARDVNLGSGKARNVRTEQVDWRSKPSLRIADAAAEGSQGVEDRLVIFPDTDGFSDGVIEAEIAGQPSEGASQAARGFVGIAFRVAPDLSRFECMYLRPTNGRADDQVRRNHSLQYSSFPEFPWHRLRKEFPEKYESYADLVPGEFTRVKVEVRGAQARLFVHGAAQPSLIVHDLKLGAAQKGAVGIWIGPGTVAHVASLRIS